MSEEKNLEPVLWGYDDQLLSSDLVGLDLEADSLFRYNEKICLVQITDGKQGVLVDPLASDLSELAQKLLARPIWMHGADYDMALMRRAWGGVPIHVYDTQIGSRLLGCRKFGYANLVEEFFGVILSKGSQKADWGKRPLPAQMAQYALNDVKYLIPLALKIQERLHASGRMSWFEESCAWEREKALERTDSRENAWRIKGSGKFDSKTLAYLKSFWMWRESEAQNWDRPSFMVAGNKDLLEWSLRAAEGHSLSLPNSMRPDRKRRFFDNLEKAASLSSEEWPEKIRGPKRERHRELEKLVDDLLAKREKCASELDLESSVLGSRTSLEALAAGDSSKLMNWQKEVLSVAE